MGGIDELAYTIHSAFKVLMAVNASFISEVILNVAWNFYYELIQFVQHLSRIQPYPSPGLLSQTATPKTILAKIALISASKTPLYTPPHAPHLPTAPCDRHWANSSKKYLKRWPMPSVGPPEK